MTPAFSHPYLSKPISHLEFVELHAEAALFFAEHNGLVHLYCEREAVTDPFVRRQHKQKGRNR